MSGRFFYPFHLNSSLDRCRAPPRMAKQLKTNLAVSLASWHLLFGSRRRGRCGLWQGPFVQTNINRNIGRLTETQIVIHEPEYTVHKFMLTIWMRWYYNIAWFFFAKSNDLTPDLQPLRSGCLRPRFFQSCRVCQCQALRHSSIAQ